MTGIVLVSPKKGSPAQKPNWATRSMYVCIVVVPCMYVCMYVCTCTIQYT